MNQLYRVQKHAMTLSLVVAVILLAAKIVASVLTGSSAIYSDAAESVVHLFAVIFAVWALRLAHKPADDTHHFGHDKISFISAGFEGAMISAAAVLIIYEAAKQIFFGVSITNIGLGMWITSIAALTNLILGMLLIRVGKNTSSPLIRANGLHVLTDVWTSVAVLGALILIKFTGWLWWDPIVAAIAALNILRIGFKLIRESLSGLLDEADPEAEKLVRQHLDAAVTAKNLSYHNFRHRHSGHSHWIEFHLVFPNEMSVNEAHHTATEIESGIASLIGPQCRVISHLEPRSAENDMKPWEEP